MKVRLETRYPEDGDIRVTFTPAKTVEAAIRLRIPGWVKGDIGVSVNGGNVNEFALDPAGVQFSVPLRADATSITVHAISEGTVAGNSGTMTVQKPSGGMNVLRWDLPAGASQTFNVDVP